jgi:hypothetical protein
MTEMLRALIEQADEFTEPSVSSGSPEERAWAPPDTADGS